MAPEDPIDVTESRQAARHIAVAPIKGNFGSTDIWIHDLGERGFQAQHAFPLKLGIAGVLTFIHPRTSATLMFRARVVWSRLSSMRAPNGKFLYRSGIRVEQLDDASRNSLDTLLREYANPDSESLGKKRRKLSDLAKRRRGLTTAAAATSVIPSEPPVPPEEVALVQKARSALRGDVVETMKWSRRAKQSIDDADALFLDREHVRNPDEVLAVWEFMERKVSIRNVVRVFELVR